MLDNWQLPEARILMQKDALLAQEALMTCYAARFKLAYLRNREHKRNSRIAWLIVLGCAAVIALTLFLIGALSA